MCLQNLPIIGAIANNPGFKTLTGAYTPGPSDAEKRGAIEAPRLAAEAAATSSAQDANAKLAARNKRRGASLLATGADVGLVQSAPSSKVALGA